MFTCYADETHGEQGKRREVRRSGYEITSDQQFLSAQCQ